MTIKYPYDPELFISLNKNLQIIIAETQKAMTNAQFALSFVNQGIKKIPESTKILAENGWYLSLDFDITFANRMAENIKEGHIELVDNEMIKFLDDEIDYIQEQIARKFPNRKKAIISALDAHKKRDFYLSVPVFFAQIEGMCNELTGKRFFKVKRNQSATAPWVNKIKSDSILRVLLEPLNIIGPMRRAQKMGNPIGINRHDVLHGDCNDYGDSEINSYKVLSLLYYVSDTVFEAKDHLINQNSQKEL